MEEIQHLELCFNTPLLGHSLVSLMLSENFNETLIQSLPSLRFFHNGDSIRVLQLKFSYHYGYIPRSNFRHIHFRQLEDVKFDHGKREISPLSQCICFFSTPFLTSLPEYGFFLSSLDQRNFDHI